MKIDLTKHDLSEISDAAKKEFDNSESLHRLTPSEIQIFLILKGLERVLHKHKIDIDFNIKVSTKRFK